MNIITAYMKKKMLKESEQLGRKVLVTSNKKVKSIDGSNKSIEVGSGRERVEKKSRSPREYQFKKY